ncbi:MAG: Lipopolysaccharide export system ATP-binding protein LptB [Alphaproteobacteria bacterium MarineAlpha10_Bin3]|jgi:branched-chain amino acid transport system ATP-binding protein|nr:MAG: Lipopolysaccharide export system ATP-binding protein LptB [Alphaproteobacteria bacterium MarineAlpha10_Bin3]PPR69957.1 MAG: Lipopolysaccharide export system ATP-binding protein LptB [Alphaproteobacteria bacterium MarineAlpha4_Bin1]
MTLILEVSDLNKSFGAVIAAQDINVTVHEHEVIGIIGANGAGKTTFINMVTGYLKPTSGQIKFAGRSIVGLKPRDITVLGIARSFQVPQVFASETVFDNLLMVYAIVEESGLGLLAPLYNDQRAERVDAHLIRYKIADYRDANASALPQGIRKLLDIAMAAACKPTLLMLDEPTSGISIDEKFELMDVIMEALRQDKTTVLFIEHDMEIVERYVSRVLAFYQGRIICDAPVAEAMVNPDVREFVIGEEFHRTRTQNDNGAGENNA